MQHFLVDMPMAPAYIPIVQCSNWLAETFRGKDLAPDNGSFPLTGERSMNKKPPAPVRARASAPTLSVVSDAPATLTQAIEPTAPTQAIEATAPTPTRGMKPMINSTVDFAAIGKENLEAFTASGKIWAAGVQDLTKQFAATAKASVEESVATFKALSTVKSIKEAIDLQSAYSKAVMAKALAESTKLTEASMKLTEQAMAPLTARLAAAVGSFSKAA
jgi:phasin family protein